ncbi:hypothetical protein CN981_08370 [Priestia megaterium]|jgi:hypothetical protein|nr:hypothetical protein CN981_08370 [Priestia megaterium]
MFRLLTRWFCTHEYHLLTTYEMDIDKGLGYDVKEFNILYCPKCRKETHVLQHDYEKIMARQRIDLEYSRK